MNKTIFAIDLGNKAAKLIREGAEPISIPSRYIESTYVDGSNKFDFTAKIFMENVDVKKYKMVNQSNSYYFGKGINELGKDEYVRESFGVGKQRYEGEKFQNMLSFSICELASTFDEQIVEVDLVLGLPSEDYTEHNTKAILNYALGQHSVEIDGNTVNVDVKVVHLIPQPIGTFYNQLFNNEGEPINHEWIKQKTAIVDIGGLTKLFDQLQNFKMEETEREQKETGMWTLYSMISDLLVCDSSVKPNKYQIENVVRKGIESKEGRFIFYPNTHGNVVDMTEAVLKAINLYTEQTIDEVKNIFMHFTSIDNLIFTGGGSKILNRDLIEKAFDNVRIIYSEDGEFANVNGFYKYGMTQRRE
ncbi:ParM/StbA family protein [Vagococcus xieshaowenii]|nr:ParM/StbA family protein [Vagococcus xieshaowenii]